MTVCLLHMEGSHRYFEIWWILNAPTFLPHSVAPEINFSNCFINHDQNLLLLLSYGDILGIDMLWINSKNYKSCHDAKAGGLDSSDFKPPLWLDLWIVTDELISIEICVALFYLKIAVTLNKRFIWVAGAATWRIDLNKQMNSKWKVSKNLHVLVSFMVWVSGAGDAATWWKNPLQLM